MSLPAWKSASRDLKGGLASAGLHDGPKRREAEQSEKLGEEHPASDAARQRLGETLTEVEGRLYSSKGEAS